MEQTDEDSSRDEQARTIGRRLRAARKVLGLNQEQMALRLGVHPKTYPKWESGESVRSWARLLAACEVFDLTPNEMLGYDPVDKLALMVKDTLDPADVGLLLESIAELAVAMATSEQPSGSDEEFWNAMGSAFVEVLAMTIKDGNTREARAFLMGAGYLLRR